MGGVRGVRDRAGPGPRAYFPRRSGVLASNQPPFPASCRAMRNRLVLAGLLALASAPALAAPAADASPTTLACRSRPASPEGRPRVGLALGGGGARGIAHIAVLR